MRFPAIVITIALSIAGSAFAQTGAPPQPGAPIGLVTRLVVVYSRFENELAGGDRTKLEKLLAPDFEELAVAMAPNAPEPDIRHIPREAWIKAAIEGAARASISQMAVHDHGDIRIASYVAFADGKQSYIVDVWKGAEAEPRLATRYRTAL